MELQKRNLRSDVWATVSLIFAIDSIWQTLNFISYKLFPETFFQIFILISTFLTPIIFGVIGLKSSAKKISWAGIILTIFSVIFYVGFLFYTFLSLGYS